MKVTTSIITAINALYGVDYETLVDDLIVFRLGFFCLEDKLE